MKETRLIKHLKPSRVVQKSQKCFSHLPWHVPMFVPLKVHILLSKIRGESTPLCLERHSAFERVKVVMRCKLLGGTPPVDAIEPEIEFFCAYLDFRRKPSINLSYPTLKPVWKRLRRWCSDSERSSERSPSSSWRLRWRWGKYWKERNENRAAL